MRNWEEGDIPMEEHAKWYPQCPHIMLVKGRGYSDMLIRGEKSLVDSAKLTADEVNKIKYLCSCLFCKL